MIKVVIAMRVAANEIAKLTVRVHLLPQFP
jgi:hypothetical protein